MALRPDVVVLKLSGAAMADATKPWDGRAYEAVADQIGEIVAGGTRCGVVIGGGNFIRAGMPWGNRGLDSSSIDLLGMMGSGWNAVALGRQLQQLNGPKPRIVSLAESAAGYAERWDVDVFGSTTDEVVIVAAGIGKEGVSTDVAAPLLAQVMGAQLIVMSKHGVDGLYDGDPNAEGGLGRKPKLLRRITAQEALDQNLRIMDRSALEQCRDEMIEIRIVGADRESNARSLIRAVDGEQIGSLVVPS